MDSTRSEAYQGYTKSILGIENINSLEVIAKFKAYIDSNTNFLQRDKTFFHKMYRSNVIISETLGILMEKDSLNQTDKIITAKDVAIDYLIATLFSAVFTLFDLNQDGIIDESDSDIDSLWNIESIDGWFDNFSTFNFSDENIGLINIMLENSGLKFELAGLAIDKWAIELLELPDSLGEDYLSECFTSGNCESISDRAVMESLILTSGELISELGVEIPYYQLMNLEDDDFDGCIDEELLDGIDNDGDGFIDEDSRGLPDSVANIQFFAARDGSDNNGNSLIDDPKEELFDLRYQQSYSKPWVSRFPKTKGEIYWAYSLDASGIATRVDKRSINTKVQPGMFGREVEIYKMDLCQ